MNINLLIIRATISFLIIPVNISSHVGVIIFHTFHLSLKVHSLYNVLTFNVKLSAQYLLTFPFRSA